MILRADNIVKYYGKRAVVNGVSVDAENKEIASKKVDEACKKMLCNQIMESYEFTIKAI